MPATVPEEGITSFPCASSTFLQLAWPTVNVMGAKDTEKNDRAAPVLEELTLWHRKKLIPQTIILIIGRISEFPRG